MEIKHIIKGHINELFGINKDLSDYRIENACKKCKVSYNEKGNFTNTCLRKNGGCGCRLKAATSLKDGKKCPMGIWYKDVINEDILEKYKI